MPVIEIAALPQDAGIRIPSVIAAVSMRVAEEMKIAPEQVWTTWRTIEPSHYVEGPNAAPLDVQPHESHPPIVNIMAYEGRSPEMIRRVLEAIAQTLCEQLGMGEGNVFITYTELKAGRVYTGGAVR